MTKKELKKKREEECAESEYFLEEMESYGLTDDEIDGLFDKD